MELKRKSMAGIGLIEVLISVVVLGVGMLGIAAMQATALRNSQSSLERSQAVIQAYTIFDAMRANSEVAISGGYNTASCSAFAGSSLVSNDISSWLQGLKDSINSTACGTITCSATTCEAIVKWDDSRAKNGSAVQQFSIKTRL
ncbi:type IV pilus modification protein PilV [Xanthomonas fragariae]|uniref:type IV pilus modification protein PilV n=1 Tax=Xanthomonas fragariae TaxID=48664 RepID=UPI0009E48652|nr:type IV pilus modification protein PilV [Xanthomonas fragariae]MBL9196006.1 type IV pilus modification protein PilV [Xanthomonas fragariae]MBL9220486.1 type IV pilus modification protein PilV [Xanthomonas fragariae]MDM7555452.1 type IV pilus modification protein PilV [Xanthomonas fragariae]MDM7558579.1 type IV pilus modification protein PilV [Xanthomonas fragariae]MDM7573197.1 type IV pilus modification protein PilV [Xanthomonas fragariae]